MVGPWAYGGFEGRHVDRWLLSRAGWRADVLRGRTHCNAVTKSPCIIKLTSNIISYYCYKLLVCKNDYVKHNKQKYNIKYSEYSTRYNVQ